MTTGDYKYFFYDDETEFRDYVIVVIPFLIDSVRVLKAEGYIEDNLEFDNDYSEFSSLLCMAGSPIHLGMIKT